MISIILPTYNEAQNITSLINHLDGVLASMPHEIIIVDDDSPDGTWKTAEALAHVHPTVRVLRRKGKWGLSSAVIDGFEIAKGEILVVMDADGQHDPALLLTVISAISGGAAIAIGSRYVSGGSVGEWVRDRRIISKLGTMFAKALSRVSVSDPLGGFFAVRASLYKQIRDRLRPTGFKILLEILAHAPKGTRITEVPLVFRMRLHGQSKLSLRIHVQFLAQILRLMMHRTGAIFLMLSGPLFALLVIVTLGVLIPRAWNLRHLYTDAALRGTVEHALKETAEKEGWLLSDIMLTRVMPDGVTFEHTPHVRGTSARQRCIITLLTQELTCDA